MMTYSTLLARLHALDPGRSICVAVDFWWHPPSHHASARRLSISLVPGISGAACTILGPVRDMDHAYLLAHWTLCPVIEPNPLALLLA